MRTLVTGGAGFIGSHVTDALLEAGHEVLIIDNLSTGKPDNVPKRAELIKADIASPEAERIVADYAPAAVFHLAAQINVRNSVADPAIDATMNVVGTIRIAHAASQSGAKAFVFTSSGGAIYGEQQRFPADELHPTRPVSPYGCAKLCGENYLDLFGRTTGMRTVSLRCANVYGPRQDGMGEAGVVAIFATRILEEKPITIYGDGRQTRDFIFVADVVRANLRALDNDLARGCFNIGTGLETDINAIAHQLMACVGHSVPLAHESARSGEQRRSVIDPERGKSELGWSPDVSLRDGLAKTVDYFRSKMATAN